MQLTKLFSIPGTVKLVQGDQNLSISHLTSDSRQAQNGCLFAAISGDMSDGHNFINQAVENGAVAILTEKIKQLKQISIL